MRKIYVLIFAILILGIKSCTNVEKEIVFIRGEKLNAIGEVSLLNEVKNSDLNFSEIILNSDEEFLKYIEENIDSKGSRNKLFLISDLFSKSLSGDNLNYNKLIYINSGKDDVFDLRIDQRYVSYIYGIVSAMVTRSNDISIVYSSDLESSFDNVLAFMLGIKQVNPRAYDLLSDGGNIFNVASVNLDDRSSKLLEFINSRKSDIIFYLDYELINEAMEISKEKMKSLVTLDSFEENIFLDIDYKYEEIIEDAFKGGIKTYFINPVDNSITVNLDKLPEEIRNKVDLNLNKLLNGSIYLPMSLEDLKKSYK